MRTLVTGATGFVGGNVARALVARGYDVRALVRPASDAGRLAQLPVEVVRGDLRDAASLRRAVAGCDAVLHVGAVYTLWTRHPEEVYAANVGGMRALLTAALDEGCERIVVTSSECTLHVPAGGVGDERTSAELADLAGPYKRSKLLSERVALDFAAQGAPVVVVNPSTPVGVGDVKPTPTGRVIVDFLNGRMPAYVDTGLNFVDVEDVAFGHVAALERGVVGERYLLANENLTLAQVLGRLARITGLQAPTVRLPHWLALAAAHANETAVRLFGGGPPRVPLDGVRASSKIRFVDGGKAVRELGVPQTPVDEALRKAVAWFVAGGYVRRRLPPVQADDIRKEAV